MKVKFIAMAIASAALAVSCAQQAGEKVPALNPDNLDTSVAPGVDFYQYATGGWQKNNPLRPHDGRVLMPIVRIRIDSGFIEFGRLELIDRVQK